jgi:HEAT repeat protein/cyclophilin family peptidyl-prolyl cis-trans isomerase
MDLKLSRQLLAAFALLAMLAGAAFPESRYARLLESKGGRDTLRLLALWEDGRVTGRGKLFAFLRSNDPLVRLRAVEVIGRIQDPEDAPYLLKMLHDKDERVVEEAVFGLGQMGKTAPAKPLLAMLTDSPPALRARIAEALGKIGGDDAVGALRNLLRDEDPGVRKNAALALARCKAPSARSSLLVAVHDEDTDVLRAVIYALENMRSNRVINTTALFLEHSDPLVRALAAEALGKLEAREKIPDLIRALRDPDPRVVINAARALGTLDSIASVHSLGRVMLKHGSHHVRRAVVSALGEIGSRKGEDYLIKACTDRSPGVRTAAVEALAKVMGKDAEMFIMMAAEDSDRYVRAKAIEALGIAGIEKRVELLKEKAAKATDPMIRAAAVSALGRLKRSDAGELLVDKVLNDDWVVATEAVNALAEIGYRLSVPSLIDAYKRRRSRVEVNVRLAILDALKKFEAREAEQLASKALEDGDVRIRKRALELLRALGVEDVNLKPARFFYERDFDPERKQALSLPLGTKHAVIRVPYGDIEVELFGDDAVQTTAEFIKLARGFYKKGQVFHRVVPNFVIQGGCPRGDGWGDAGHFIRSEFNRHTYETGYIGIAHDGKDTGGSQFFITLLPQHHLDGRYTIFGRVVKGMDIVNKIDQGDHFTVVVPGD